LAYEFAGRQIAHDDEGYLVSLGDWSRDLAPVIARADGIELTPAHWEIVDYIREYYEEYLIVPAIRQLTRAIEKKLGKAKANAAYLNALFPGGPAKQASKFAGLPKPTGCV
jgi:tRNA 2-thiouridine synthesizing protein E